MTVAETRTRLRVSRATVDNLWSEGLLELVYIFTGVPYRASQVDQLVRSGTGRRLPGVAA